MTFYQELQLNQAGSKNLLKKSETRKEKLYHMWVYLVKIAVTLAFCFFFVSIFSILFGNENSIVGVVVLLCLMVFRNADLGIHIGQSTMLLALFFVIMTVPRQQTGHPPQRKDGGGAHPAAPESTPWCYFGNAPRDDAGRR